MRPEAVKDLQRVLTARQALVILMEKNYRANHDPWLEVVLMSPRVQLIYRLGLIVAYGPVALGLVAAVVQTVQAGGLSWWHEIEASMVFAVGLVVWALVVHGLWRWLFSGYFKDS